MAFSNIEYKGHAITRMLERGITFDEVRAVLKHDDVIRRYPEDTPLPSRLLLGWVEGRPVHVVAADDPGEKITYIITVYEPDAERWSDDFRTRREP